jgi:hypothetical protein
MTPEIRENLFEIATENAEELYNQYGAEGLWVKEVDLPSDASEFTKQEYEAVLSPERFANVDGGDPVTEAESEALRNHRLETIIYVGDCDADTIPAYCLAEVKDADGNGGIALILCKGYSFSVLKIWVHRIFETREAAKVLHGRRWMDILTEPRQWLRMSRSVDSGADEISRNVPKYLCC